MTLAQLRPPIAVSLGAMAGALNCYYLGTWFSQMAGLEAFPIGTMAVNVLGCFPGYPEANHQGTCQVYNQRAVGKRHPSIADQHQGELIAADGSQKCPNANRYRRPFHNGTLLGSGYTILAFRTQAEKLQGVIKNSKVVRFVQLFFQGVDGALVNGNGVTALQAGEVMPVFLG